MNKVNFNLIKSFKHHYNQVPSIARKIDEYKYFEAYLHFMSNSFYYRRFDYLYDGFTIHGRQLNNKVNSWRKINIIGHIYNDFIDRYMKSVNTQILKYLSTDTKFIPNKHATKTNLVKRNKYYKNKFGVKLSTLVDANGIPLNLLIESGSAYDSTLVEHLFNSNLLIGLKSGNYVTSKKFKRLLLADSGYDSEKVKKFLNEISITPIIAANKRNTKNPNKLKAKNFSNHQKQIYKKRIKVENYFSWIINIMPRLNWLLDANTENYLNSVRIATLSILINRNYV